VTSAAELIADSFNDYFGDFNVRITPDDVVVGRQDTVIEQPSEQWPNPSWHVQYRVDADDDGQPARSSMRSAGGPTIGTPASRRTVAASISRRLTKCSPMTPKTEPRGRRWRVRTSNGVTGASPTGFASAASAPRPPAISEMCRNTVARVLLWPSR
jgi:hypothetical protein